MRSAVQLVRDLIHHAGNVARGLRLAALRAAGVAIGQDTMISMGAKLDVRRGKIRIGNHCFVTYGAVILSHDRARRQVDPGEAGEGEVVIDDYVFVGVNAVVLPGVHIGTNSVVGAGAVVSRNVPPGCVVAGNPAEVIKVIQRFRNDFEHYMTGRDPRTVTPLAERVRAALNG
jgi:acetyltransferase-like isoleucine patch superfamily enzyme